jgi:hypothetical protein
MPGDTKHERRLGQIRAIVLACGLAVAGIIYVFRHFFGS